MNNHDEEYRELEEKIESLLDCVERPLGTLKPRIPQSEQSERAIIALYDAIGRTL